jgi:septal ring factor EnvC (AmiA/AmiB activator)
MRATRIVADKTTQAIIAEARADLARHYRKDQEFRQQIARVKRRLRESEHLLREIDTTLARLGGRR